MSFGYNEDLLQFIWEHQLYHQKDLHTEEGQPVIIIKQGFLNTNSGPDFEQAQVKIGNTTHYGSIEIHLDSKDWHQHNHEKDISYNTVILHVCNTYSKPAYRQDGTLIPTLVIGKHIDKKSIEKYHLLMASKPFIPCENQLAGLSSFDINSWLDRMLIERLQSRFELFSGYLEDSNHNWNQSFYTAILRSFGLPINTESFEELAQKLPFELVQKHQLSLFQLEALFFGVSGLLLENQGDNYYIGLQNEYFFLKSKYHLAEINSKLKMGRMRPMNLPHVKIAQLAAFFHHVPDFINLVLDLPEASTVKLLLDFSLSDYWQKHYTFNTISKQSSKKISSGFINHLFINAIVPFVFFYQKMKNNNETTIALDYLDSIPIEKNSIIERWKSIIVINNNACSSQALLHLYKNYCKQKKCLQCNLGKKLLLKQDATN